MDAWLQTDTPGPAIGVDAAHRDVGTVDIGNRTSLCPPPLDQAIQLQKTQQIHKILINQIAQMQVVKLRIN